eukprot:scaffold8884_cov44-Attheya_sp.AAC.5
MYRNGSQEKLKDASGGMDCIQCASETLYWEWNCGSRLFFWRWSPQYLERARDGVPLRVEGEFKRNLRTQPRELDKDTKAKVREKLKKVRDRRYVSPGFVYVLTKFFAVPKGESEIRMVYDASFCQVNVVSNRYLVGGVEVANGCCILLNRVGRLLTFDELLVELCGITKNEKMKKTL